MGYLAVNVDDCDKRQPGTSGGNPYGRGLGVNQVATTAADPLPYPTLHMLSIWPIPSEAMAPDQLLGRGSASHHPGHRELHDWPLPFTASHEEAGRPGFSAHLFRRRKPGLTVLFPPDRNVSVFQLG